MAMAAQSSGGSLKYAEKFAHRDSHLNSIRCADFNHSGSFLATGSDDNSLKIWSCSDGSLHFEIVGHAPVLSIRWTADPLVLVAGFEDNLLVTIVISYDRVRFFVSPHPEFLN